MRVDTLIIKMDIQDEFLEESVYDIKIDYNKCVQIISINQGVLYEECDDFLKGIDGELVPVDPTEIDWFSPDKTYLKTLIFKADPGKKNPLGNIKFMFSNKYAVYLHDTNQRSLFNLEKRALSSGCIRVNLPFTLLEYLHPKQPINLIQKTESKSIVFQQKVPIFIRYMTAYVDDNNHVHFYKDIYGYDSLLENTTISNKLVSQ